MTYAVRTTYYTFGGQRVAMRQNNAVYWLHGDHLGSASLTTNITGTVVSEVRYFPFGETRWFTGTAPTNRLYTGQRSLMGIGLYDYNARMYSPSLGRFISADTVVPEPGKPQALNRYSYVNNRPLNLSDPTGHCGFSPSGTPICATANTLSVNMTVVPMVDTHPYHGLAGPIPVAAPAWTAPSTIDFRPPAAQPGEIKPFPQDVTTMMAMNDPASLVTLAGPLIAPLYRYAPLAVQGMLKSAAIGGVVDTGTQLIENGSVDFRHTVSAAAGNAAFGGVSQLFAGSNVVGKVIGSAIAGASNGVVSAGIDCASGSCAGQQIAFTVLVNAGLGPFSSATTNMLQRSGMQEVPSDFIAEILKNFFQRILNSNLNAQ